jgi:hypothetical protein
MKKIIVTAILGAMVLAGCAQPDNGKMVQPIQSDSISENKTSESASQPSTDDDTQNNTQNNTSDQNASANNAASNNTGSNASSAQNGSGQGNGAQNNGYQNNAAQNSSPSDIVTGVLETDENNYYSYKAQIEALDIDTDNLEAQYRIGQIDRDTFRTQKQELNRQENQLECYEEWLEESIELNYRANRTLPEGTPDELLAQKRDLETDDAALEIEEDTLKLQYRNGEISREDFISEMTDVIRREDALDRQDEAIEDALELMGWDD